MKKFTGENVDGGLCRGGGALLHEIIIRCTLRTLAVKLAETLGAPRLHVAAVAAAAAGGEHPVVVSLVIGVDEAGVADGAARVHPARPAVVHHVASLPNHATDLRLGGTSRRLRGAADEPAADLEAVAEAEARSERSCR